MVPRDGPVSHLLAATRVPKTAQYSLLLIQLLYLMGIQNSTRTAANHDSSQIYTLPGTALDCYPFGESQRAPETMTSEHSSDTLLSLFLSPDNISNCTLSTADDHVVYTVLTEHTSKTVTQVRDAENEVIASLEWRENLPDRVTLGMNKPVSMGDWMRKSLIPFNQ